VPTQLPTQVRRKSVENTVANDLEGWKLGTNSIELSALAKIPLVESRRVATRYARRVAQVVRVAPCLLVVPTWRTTKKQ